MKIRSVNANNRRKVFEVTTSSRTLEFSYSKADPRPTATDPIVSVAVDRELGREAFTYVLKSGIEGSVHIDHVLDYNRDPAYMRDMLLYKLTLEARKRVEASPLAKRELIRRLATSATQFYRLLDPTNRKKSIDQMLSLLQVLDCTVDLKIRTNSEGWLSLPDSKGPIPRIRKVKVRGESMAQTIIDDREDRF